MAEAMQRNGFSSLSSYGDAFVCYCESMEQFQLREAPLAVAARVGAGLGHLRVRCVSSCTTLACTAGRECLDVSLVGFAVLAGDVQHIDALMGQMGHGCSLAFLEMPCERGQHTWRSVGFARLRKAWAPQMPPTSIPAWLIKRRPIGA